MEKRRDPSVDNLRAGLIFLVVLGHLMEMSPDFWGRDTAYFLIYSVHMPAFVFLSGRFSRFRPVRTLWSVVWPYVVFQLVYLFFSGWYYGTPVTVQFTTPYWLMWYLMALACYQLLIPVYDRATAWGRGLVLAISAAVAVGAGFADRIGYELSLSRFLVFQPWFILGYSSRTFQPKHGTALGLLSGALAGAAWLALLALGPRKETLYGSYSYAALGYGPQIRILAMLAALGAIGAMMLLVRPLLRRQIPVFTAVGQNTLSVYLLHGLAVRLIGKYAPMLLRGPVELTLTALALVLVLGCPAVGRAMTFLLSDRWWRTIQERIRA